ncbi:hypothetical protein [Paenibacillus sp. Root444D2]|nr:hypothetical protein [Paenibacillus sp. Root444D2]
MRNGLVVHHKILNQSSQPHASILLVRDKNQNGCRGVAVIALTGG